MKTNNITFWISTRLIFLFEGVMPALFSQTEMAKEGIRQLGYPDYFGIALVVFKVLGALILIVPRCPARLREWAYAGFTFNLLFAAISHASTSGLGTDVLFPLVILAILMISYVSWHRKRPNAKDVNNTLTAV
jgi:hypothetical protein